MKLIRRDDDRPARSTVTRRTAVCALLVVPGLGGCSFVSPQTTATTYAASDGVNGSISDPATGATVDLRNMLLVAAEKDGPGTLVGVLESDSDSAIPVAFTVRDAEGRALGSGSVPAGANQLTRIGFDGGAQIRIASVPVFPGGTLVLEARTGSGGGEPMTLPVLAPVGPYASLDPSAARTSPRPRPSPSESGSASPADSPSPAASASPSAG